MSESPGSLELLATRVDELERRAHALERPNAHNVLAEKLVVPAVVAPIESSHLQTADLFPTLGRAMLGIAGAYVLRAVAETGVVPRIPVAAAGVAYAFGWLVWSRRASKASGIVPLVYAATAALILLPLLWEVTLDFH